VTGAQIMTHITQRKKLDPVIDLWPTLEEMDRGGVNLLPVMTDKQMLAKPSWDWRTKK